MLYHVTSMHVRVPVVLSRVFLEDALILQCGCSFGGLVLNKVIEMVTDFFMRYRVVAS